jgi:hypothetical protein
MDTKQQMGNEARLKAGKLSQYFLDRGNPVPLWLAARSRVTGFRCDDLERTHWKKVGRSMFAD